MGEGKREGARGSGEHEAEVEEEASRRARERAIAAADRSRDGPRVLCAVRSPINPSDAAGAPAEVLARVPAKARKAARASRRGRRRRGAQVIKGVVDDSPDRAPLELKKAGAAACSERR